jgi:mRNA interferase MazF
VIRQGQVYWLNLPEPEGSEPGYRRPCLVLQNDTFNRSKIRTTIICILTTNLRLGNAPGNVVLEQGEANLNKDSVANISQLLTVNKSDLSEQIGQISITKLDEILLGLRKIF